MFRPAEEGITNPLPAGLLWMHARLQDASSDKRMANQEVGCWWSTEAIDTFAD